MEFRQMRRFRQALSEKDCIEILLRNTSGVLSVRGDDGYPYGVPLSYVYEDGKILFHSASRGHKIDAIRACDKASFCVIDKDQIVPEEFTSYFSSVIVFGRARLLEDDKEKESALLSLIGKYSSKVPDSLKEKEMSHCNAAIIELKIEHMTGKKAIELCK